MQARTPKEMARIMFDMLKRGKKVLVYYDCETKNFVVEEAKITQNQPA